MTDKKTYELTDVGLQQAGKAILYAFLPFMIGFFGSMIYDVLITPHVTRGLFFPLKIAAICSVVGYGIGQLLPNKKKNLANKVLLKIDDEQFIVEVDDEKIFDGKIQDLKAIRTLDPINKKDSVQCQIYAGDVIVSLASNLNYMNKLNMDDFTKYCEKRLHMAIKPVPFSIYTSNFQGIKYLEYYNPQNPLITK